MSENERDTHFQNAANLLYYKLAALKGTMPPHLSDDEWIRAEQTLIAHFLYDFFYHVMDHAQDEVYYPPEQWLGHVPDLKEWPVKPDETQC